MYVMTNSITSHVRCKYKFIRAEITSTWLISIFEISLTRQNNRGNDLNLQNIYIVAYIVVLIVGRTMRGRAITKQCIPSENSLINIVNLYLLNYIT